ncbi:MAG TPA: SusC/RagA family TonB-linked outer membrane protein, partial [Chryseolinea sp.]
MKKVYRRSKRAMLLFLWLALAHSALAQERIVSGLAKDESGNGMPGVNVLIKGTNVGTATDGNGKYQIAVNTDNAVLVFSFIGYTTQEVNVGTQTALDVSMAPDTQTLNEIVVTGYAAQEKKDITGAVGVVKAKELLAFPAANAETLLQGRVAGVTVTANGDPNGLPAVRIRGLTSFQNNTPLYIVDGVPTYNIQFLNPNDIETMNVLKDAGAASIYGSRANNGVIIVTTKKGRAGKVTVSYDGTVGVQMPGEGLESQLLNPQEMAELEWLQKSNDGLPFSSPNYGSGSTPVLPDYLVPVGAHEGDPSVNPSLYNVDYAKGPIYQITRANKAGTNWWDEATDPAPVQSHNISVAGGNEASRYMVGFNYYDQKGLFVGTGLKRYTVRANTEFKIKNVVRIGENLSAAFYDRKPLWEGVAVHTLQPIIPAYDIMGGFAGTRGSNLGNNAGIMGRLIPNEDNFSSETKIFGNIYAEVDLFKDFMFRSSFGGSLSNSYTTRFTRHYYENSENNGSNSLQENAQYENDWIWTNTLTYKKKLDQHSFLVVAGMEAVKEGIGRRLQGSRIDYFTDSPDYRSLATGSAGIQNTSNYLTPSSLLSYFGRLDYNYGDKYFLSGTIRRDGSSK